MSTENTEKKDERPEKPARGDRGDRKPRGPRPPRDQQESEWIDNVVKVYRVAKVVKGGRRFSFSAIVVVGDGKGRVGAAMGKAAGVPAAIQKAKDRALKNLTTVPIVNTTVPHIVEGRSDSANVLLKPASLGTGVVAGGAVRAVVEAAGYKNILTKSLGSNNPTNVVWATIAALKQLETAEQIAERRGLPVSAVL